MNDNQIMEVSSYQNLVFVNQVYNTLLLTSINYASKALSLACCTTICAEEEEVREN